MKLRRSGAGQEGALCVPAQSSNWLSVTVKVLGRARAPQADMAAMTTVVNTQWSFQRRSGWGPGLFFRVDSVGPALGTGKWTRVMCYPCGVWRSLAAFACRTKWEVSLVTAHTLLQKGHWCA